VTFFLHCEAFGRIALKLGTRSVGFWVLTLRFAVLAEPQNAQTRKEERLLTSKTI